MKQIDNFINEKLIINKNIKINKKINKETYKPFNIIKNVNNYVDRIFNGFGVKTKQEIKDFLNKYIKEEVLIYLTGEHTHGDGYKLKTDIEDYLKKEIDSIEINLGLFENVIYNVYEYNNQYVIIENRKLEYILIDGK